jgi:endoglucanase
VLLFAVGVILVPVLAGAFSARNSGSTAVTARVQGLRVSGNQILNASGKAVRLIGFNNSGAEYACEEGWGIFDTPQTTMTRAIVAAMATWAGANTVRVPVNEQCWLGLPGVKAAYAGASYRRAIERYVSLLNAYGFAVILDLAGTAPGTEKSVNQEEMPDSHSVAFWRSAAAAFKRNTSVAFDLFNEPWPDNDADTAAAWSCWRSGGCAQVSQNGGAQYRAAGMQQLVSAVRGTGARNIVIAEGIQYAETVDQWLKYRPSDPAGNLVASVHVYSFNGCSTLRCYNGAMKTLAGHVPVLIGELGPDLTTGYTPALDADCPPADVGRDSFDSALLSWAAQNKVSWTAWSLNPWGDCWSLVKGFTGAPTSPYGVIIKSALAEQRQTAAP